MLRGFAFLVAICLTAAPAAQAQSLSNAHQALFDRGVAANQSGKLIESITVFTDLIAAQPDLAEVYYQRGLAFDGIGETARAINDFAEAVGLGVDKLGPFLRLIAHYKENRLYPAALIVTDQILAHLPENAAGAYWDKGQIYEAMGDRRNAIAAYEACLVALDADGADFAVTVQSRISALE